MNNMIVKTLFGSHLYGLDTPESDKDYKGIFMPTKEEILLGRIPSSINESTGDDHSKNTNQDVDYETFSLHQFIKLAIKGETVAIDMLHTNPSLIDYEESPMIHIFTELQSKRTMFYCKDMKAYMGYVRKQAHKYGVRGSRIAAVKSTIEYLERLVDEGFVSHKDTLGHAAYFGLVENDYCGFLNKDGKQFYVICGRKLELRTKIGEVLSVLNKILQSYGDRARKAEDNDGVDWKAISHALRAGYQMREIFKHGDFEYPLKETDFILKVKQGQLDFKKQVQKELESLVDEVYDLSETTNKVPEKVDQEFWDQWLMNKVQEFYFNE